MATIDGSITMISMPDIFRGIDLDPLVPGNSLYLLWMVLGLLVATSVLVVSLGRLGDIVGRVKVFRVGYIIYTAGFAAVWRSTGCTATPARCTSIVFRARPRVGGACLLANASAIITDAFPATPARHGAGARRIVAVCGSVHRALSSAACWRRSIGGSCFLISVPVGVIGTATLAYRSLRELSSPRAAPIDWWGNATFAAGLVLVMVAVTYGIRPAGGHATGWASLRVLTLVFAGLVCLVAFVKIERRTAAPMFRLSLFRIRAFTFGTLSTLLASIARGGLMFVLIIWLQGIWLPQHGVSFADTPLCARGSWMLPLTFGLLAAAPLSGFLSDRFGARPFSTTGMLMTAGSLGFSRCFRPTSPTHRSRRSCC